MNDTLSVYLHERKVGTLSDVGNAQLRFNYDKAYLERYELALSKSLPLTTEPFTDQRARPFFSGILPDDQQLEGLAQHLKVSRRNVFKLLREVGGECAGAVSLYDDDTELNKTDDASKDPISESMLLGMLNTAKSRPILGGDDKVRLSLAGAQSKIAVVIKESQIYLSTPSSPSTHIIKPTSSAIKGLVKNECFCMQLANDVGIEVPEVSLRTVLGETAYQVERYDRIEQHGEVKRLHQEDFCQALGVVPENKYEFEGGPGVKECIELIQEVSDRPALDYQRLLERVVFNYLIGNNDAHAKNFSLLYQNQSCQLAPAYDLVSTAIYPELNNNMAMKIGGRKHANDLQLRHWERLVPDTKTSKRALKEAVLTLCRKVENSLLEYEGANVSIMTDRGLGEDIMASIVNVVTNRIQRLRSLFS